MYKRQGYASNGRAGVESTSNYDLLTSHASILEQVQNEAQNIKVRGDSVVLTLDTRMQQAAYNALGSYRGAVVVMEPSTGRILAMVSKPDFDPNTLSEDWDTLISDESSSALLNRAAQGLYPPGSTFKILTTLAYLKMCIRDSIRRVLKNEGEEGVLGLAEKLTGQNPDLSLIHICPVPVTDFPGYPVLCNGACPCYRRVLYEMCIRDRDNAAAFRMMFERINQGEAMASCIARVKIFDGTFSWFRCV